MKPYYDEGGITIYHGDCRDALPRLGTGSVAAVITDPPFFMPAIHYSGRVRYQRSWGDASLLGAWWDDTVEAMLRCLLPSGSLVTFCNDESYPVFYPGLYRRFDSLRSLVWDKGKIGMGSTWRRTHELILVARWRESKWLGGHSRSDVLRVQPVQSSARLHPVDKPVELLRGLIEPVADTGEIILDPFMGGGSTLAAAAASGRRAIGIETEERYCEIAANRLTQGVLDLGAAACAS